MQGRLIFLLLLPLLCSSTALAAAEPLQPSDLMKEISSEGAPQVVRRLYDNGDAWNEVMGKIRTGNARWLEVARNLHAGTDGATSEELDLAIFFALAPAPQAVLNLLADGEFDVEYVCSSNVHVDYPLTESRRLVEERLRVLRGVNAKHLVDIRDSCKSGLRQALRDLDRLGPGD
jgi:hypothetical protein